MASSIELGVLSIPDKSKLGAIVPPFPLSELSFDCILFISLCIFDKLFVSFFAFLALPAILAYELALALANIFTPVSA